MTDQPIPLTSAEAVEVALFCWPSGRWQEHWRDAGVATSTRRGKDFHINEWGAIHRAAAVLVERGHGAILWSHLAEAAIRPDAPHVANYAVLAIAESDWARAILATVREVRG